MIEREVGLYKNGRLWWTRVLTVPRSTGTDNLEIANRIVRLVRELSESPKTRHFVEAVAEGELTLPRLYQHRTALSILDAALSAETTAKGDTDLAPLVDCWRRDHLPTLDISERQRDEYERQVRALIPAGVRFPASKFTENTLRRALHGLTEPRSGAKLSPSTMRRYAVAWKLFWRYARKRAAGLPNPFDDPDWIPANASPRTVFWDHETTLRVLARMQGEAKVAMTLVFGSGMELGALLDMQGRHVNPTPADARELPTVVAPGSKNEHREQRTIFVNRWAWPEVRALADTRKPRERLFTLDEKALREAFYCAQLAEGLVDEPEKGESGKLLWGEVEPHRVHDARHTYCVVRLLGLDGEPRQSLKFCSMQLGHADEQMVMKIYSKANIDQRLRMIELAEARNGRGK